jgi:hypothetical protein
VERRGRRGDDGGGFSEGDGGGYGEGGRYGEGDDGVGIGDGSSARLARARKKKEIGEFLPALSPN